MPRFYQTTDPHYVDFIYQPPWELAERVLSTKQQEYDLSLSATKALNDLLEIQYLDSEANKGHVEQITQRWESEINDLTEQIKKDPLNAGSYLHRIEGLTRDIQKERKTGLIGQLESAYAARQKTIEDNKKIKEEYPNRFEAGLRYYDNLWLESGADDLASPWRGGLITKDLNWDEIIKSTKDLKANIVEGTVKTPTGTGYLVKQGGKTVEMSEDRLYNYLLSQVLDPESLASLRQSQLFGLGQYFSDEDLNQIDPTAPGFRNLMLAAGASAYREQTSEVEYSPDSKVIADINNQAKRDLEILKHTLREQAKDNDVDRSLRAKALEVAMNIEGIYPEETQNEAINLVNAFDQITTMDYLQGKNISSLEDAIASGEENLIYNALDNFTEGMTEEEKLTFSAVFRDLIDEKITKDELGERLNYDYLSNNRYNPDITEAFFLESLSRAYSKPYNNFIKSQKEKREEYKKENGATNEEAIKKFPTSKKAFADYFYKENKRAHDRHLMETNGLIKRVSNTPYEELSSMDKYKLGNTNILVDPKKMETFFKNFNSEIERFNVPHAVQTQNLTPIGQRNITNLVQQNPQAFMYTYENGTQVEGEVKTNFRAEKIGDVTEGGLNIIGTLPGGKKVIATPIVNRENAVSLNLSKLLTTEIAPTSQLYPSVVNQHVRKIKSIVNKNTFSKGVGIESNSKTVQFNPEDIGIPVNATLGAIKNPITGVTTFSVYPEYQEAMESSVNPFETIATFHSEEALVDYLLRMQSSY